METLEILAGLTFIYLVLSLVCTAANELISQLINLRGKTLRTGLRTLVEGPETRSLFTRFIKPQPKPSESKPTTTDPDAAWRAVEKAASAEAAAFKAKAEEVARAVAVAESRRARALQAASLAERSGTEVAATEATRAANDRNSAQDDVSRLVKELADVRATLFRQAPAASREWETAKASRHSGTSPTDWLYNHPLIAGLRPFSRLAGSRLPSYIPPDTFALVLLELVTPAAGSPKSLVTLKEEVRNLPPQLQKSLTVLIDQAGDNVKDLQLGISRWFSDAMERVSGVYKRRAQIVTLVLALLVTLGANADTIRIWKTLSQDATVRAAVLSTAEAYSRGASPPPQTSTTPDTTGAALSLAIARLDSAMARLDNLDAFGVPLGWRDMELDRTTVPGWLITMLAISLGAPFWFDMLNKVMNIRAAGRAPEEKPKSPEALPPPRGA